MKTVDDSFDDDAPLAADDALPEGYTAKPSWTTDSLTDATGLAVIDVSNLAYRSAYAYSDLTTSDGRRSGHVYGSVRLLASMLQNDLEPGRWLPVFCYDGIDAKVIRRSVLPAYKANRSDGRFNPIPDVEAVLRQIPGLHLKHDEREGDDAIAWIAQKMHRADRPLVVLSGDRDLWALMALPGVEIHSPNLKRRATTEDVKEKYLVDDPRRIYWAKALFGDASDGVAGVERLLKKHVGPHLNAAKDFHDFFDLVRDADSKLTSENTKAKVVSNFEKIAVNLEVVTPRIDGFERHHLVKVGPECRATFEASLRDYQCASLLGSAGMFFGDSFVSRKQ